MKNHVENIRASVKKEGYTPTSDQIRRAIDSVCGGVNVLENKSKIVSETIKLINSQELISATPEKKDTNLFNLDNANDTSNSSDPEEENKINKNKLPVFISDSDEINSSEIIVSPEDKHELIVDQASCLGIELSEVEVIDLATSIKDSFLDHECLIEDVVTAIVSYHDNRTNRLEQKIKDAREHIESRRKQLNQTLVGEFGEMNNFFRQGGDKRKELSKIIAATFKT